MRKVKELKHSIPRPLFILITVLLVIILVLGFFRVWAYVVLRHQTNHYAIPIVNIITVKSSLSKEEEIILPGTVRAWHDAPIYARTNGYIKKWYVDIGSRVKKGDLLAQIETPELDAQLRQAEADLNVVEAKNKLAQSTAVRWINLLKTDSVSKQETDEKVDTANALNASVLSAQANVDRLKELVSFERVIAPFSGVISDRATDIGALINAGSSSNAKALFRLVQTNPLRVYVKIPQTYSSNISPDMTVKLYFAEHPGQVFTAKLLQTANAIDPKTLTLLAQFIVNNENGLLLPGGYAEVHFKMPVSSKKIRLPVNALLFRSEGLQVATLNKESKIVLKSITVSRDFGKEVEVSSGIHCGERIIINPPDSLFNGELVRLGRPQ